LEESDNPDAEGSSHQGIGRAALERVLARAAELQGAGGETPDELTEAQLLDVGREVGLSPQHLKQALAEERTRSLMPDREHGILARVVGPAHAQASRTVSGSSTAVLGTLDAWMQRQELLQVKRHLVDRLVWEPRRDFLGALRRALNLGGRGFALTRAHEVSATVIPIDPSRVHVSLAADLSSHRAHLSSELAGTSVIGAAATGALIVMGITTAAAVLPVILLPAGAYIGVRSVQAKTLLRAQLALEQVLDRLERGEFGARPSLLSAIVK
jgi:hypothetical protein